MGRTTKAMSKARMICLTDDEEKIVLELGNGSRTAGIRQLLEIQKIFSNVWPDLPLSLIAELLEETVGVKSEKTIKY